MIERYKRYFEHDATSNRQALESIATIPVDRAGEPQAKKARSVLMHTVEAKALWLTRIEPGVIPAPTEMFPADPSPDAIASRMKQVDAAWHDWLSHVSEAKCRNVIEYSAFDGGRWRTRIEDVLTQLTHHGAYHRGQIASLVKQSGGTPAVTDWIFVHREKMD